MPSAFFFALAVVVIADAVIKELSIETFPVLVVVVEAMPDVDLLLATLVVTAPTLTRPGRRIAAAVAVLTEGAVGVQSETADVLPEVAREPTLTADPYALPAKVGRTAASAEDGMPRASAPAREAEAKKVRGRRDEHFTGNSKSTRMTNGRSAIPEVATTP